MRSWFTPWGWVYRPTSAAGLVVVALTIACGIQLFVAVDRRSHSATDTLHGIFPFIVPSPMLLNWVASKTSGPRPTA